MVWVVAHNMLQTLDSKLFSRTTQANRVNNINNTVNTTTWNEMKDKYSSFLINKRFFSIVCRHSNNFKIYSIYLLILNKKVEFLLNY